MVSHHKRKGIAPERSVAGYKNSVVGRGTRQADISEITSDLSAIGNRKTASGSLIPDGQLVSICPEGIASGDKHLIVGCTIGKTDIGIIVKNATAIRNNEGIPVATIPDIESRGVGGHRSRVTHHKRVVKRGTI